MRFRSPRLRALGHVVIPHAFPHALTALGALVAAVLGLSPLGCGIDARCFVGRAQFTRWTPSLGSQTRVLASPSPLSSRIARLAVESEIDPQAVDHFLQRQLAGQVETKSVDGGRTVFNAEPVSLTDVMTESRELADDQELTLEDVVRGMRVLAASFSSMDEDDEENVDFFLANAEALLEKAAENDEVDVNSAMELLNAVSILNKADFDMTAMAPPLAEVLPGLARYMTGPEASGVFVTVAGLLKQSLPFEKTLSELLQRIIDEAEELTPKDISQVVFQMGDLHLGTRVKPVLDSIVPYLTTKDLEKFTLEQLGMYAWGIASIDATSTNALVPIQEAAMKVASLLPHKKKISKRNAKGMTMLLGAVRKQFGDVTVFQDFLARTFGKQFMLCLDKWGFCLLLWAWPGADPAGEPEHLAEFRSIMEKMERHRTVAQKLKFKDIYEVWKGETKWHLRREQEERRGKKPGKRRFQKRA